MRIPLCIASQCVDTPCHMCGPRLLRMSTLWLAPLVEDPAAMLPSESSATIEMVSWLCRLTLLL